MSRCVHMPFFVVGDTYRITVDVTKVPSYTNKKSVHTGILVHLPNVMNLSSQGREVVYTVYELEDLHHIPIDPYLRTSKIVLLTLLEDGEEHYFTMNGPLPNGYILSIVKS
jgi:hypothetical protein